MALRPGQTEFDDIQLASLRQLGIGNPNRADLAVFFHQCRRTGLDPFLKQIYLITRMTWNPDTQQREPRATIQTGIDGFRLVVRRGADVLHAKLHHEGPFWCGVDGVWRDIWPNPDEPPLAARYTIFLDGEPFPGVAHFHEFAATKDEYTPDRVEDGRKIKGQKTGRKVPSGKWVAPAEGGMPAHMLAKCLPGGTRIQTDRGSLTIGQIVRERLPVRVRSVNLATGHECWSLVVNWWRNPPTHDWVRVRTPNGGRGNRTLRLTPDHPLWTAMGWRAAGDLAPGDPVAVTSPTLTPQQVQVIQGGLLGDGCLAGRRRSSTQPYYSEAHSVAQEGYLRWKAAALANLGSSVTEVQHSDGAGGTHSVIRLRTRASAALYDFRLQKPVERLAALGELGLAVWFMDDGAIKATGGMSGSVSAALYCCGFGTEFADSAVEWFRAEHGLAAKVLRRDRNPYLVFGVADTARLLALLAPYMKCEGTTKRWIAGPIEQGSEAAIAYVPVLEVERVTTTRAEWRYDIEVEGTHTFVVNNVVVSNCAEALASRKAFPQDLSGIYIDEEMERWDAEAVRVVPNGKLVIEGPGEPSGRDWLAEIAATESGDEVNELWFEIKGRGELTAEIQAAITARGVHFRDLLHQQAEPDGQANIDPEPGQ